VELCAKETYLTLYSIVLYRFQPLNYMRILNLITVTQVKFYRYSSSLLQMYLAKGFHNINFIELFCFCLC